jgi:Flp pilus assembly protein TadD
LPIAFLLDSQGNACKIYQGALPFERMPHDARDMPKTSAERMARGLPLPGVSETYEVGRNYLSFGAVFYDRGYFEQAEAYFLLAAKEDPSGAEPLYGLGSVCLERHKDSEAWDYFQRAVKAQANYPGTVPNSWNDLGLLAARAGKTDEAIGYFAKALEINPEHAVALQNLGNAYRQKRDWKNAEKTLQRAVELHPDDPEANYGLGMVYAQRNDTQRAYEYLQRALEGRPAYPEALNNLGILYLRTGRPEDAKKSFAESMRVAPDYAQAYLNLSRVYAIEGDKAKARTPLEELLKIHPDNTQARKELDELAP